jgi:hypothetical protein
VKKAEVYGVWADIESLWSQWTKPVLFSFVEHELPTGAERVAASDLSWLPDANASTAVVVDLPGAESVWFGIELARRGYRPVPLYNALPFPLPPDPAVRTAVDVESILMALKAATHVLRGLTIPSGAPPAFLLDANRRRSRFRLSAGDFDNRSVCFTTDFPSAELLSENGIHTVILVQRDSHPEADLARVLASWQSDELSLLQKDIGYAVGLARLRIEPPRWWERAWQWILNTGLHRSPLGGFGDIVQSAG